MSSQVKCPKSVFY